MHELCNALVDFRKTQSASNINGFACEKLYAYMLESHWSDIQKSK